MRVADARDVSETRTDTKIHSFAKGTTGNSRVDDAIRRPRLFRLARLMHSLQVSRTFLPFVNVNLLTVARADAC